MCYVVNFFEKKPSCAYKKMSVITDVSIEEWQYMLNYYKTCNFNSWIDKCFVYSGAYGTFNWLSPDFNSWFN